MEPLKFKVNVESPLEETWNAWINEEVITKWFSPEANIEPRLGGAYELFFDPQDHSHMSTIGCVVTELEPLKSLAFTWKGPDQYATVMNDPNSLTYVRVKFHGDDGGTRVSVVHDGWGDSEAWSEAREWHMNAWEGVLAELMSFMSGKRSD